MGKCCVKRVKARATIPPSTSEETVRRVLRKASLKWTHIQGKEILTKNDLKWRLKFAWKVRRKLSGNFWEEGVGFYLDGVSFTHKMNPPRALAWGKPGQGLDFSFTGKRSHKSIGGNIAHFMATISYGKDAFTMEQYHDRINAKKYVNIFPACLKKC